MDTKKHFSKAAKNNTKHVSIIFLEDLEDKYYLPLDQAPIERQNSDKFTPWGDRIDPEDRD